jgi:hypothetical protein
VRVRDDAGADLAGRRGARRAGFGARAPADPESARTPAHPRWRGLWALLVGTGLRLGVARALRWRDVDEEAGALQLQVIAHIDEPVTLDGDDVEYSSELYGSDIDKEEE